MEPYLCGPQPGSQGGARSGSCVPGSAGMVDRRMRARGSAAQAVASDSTGCSRVRASSMPRASPMATRNSFLV
eukprot:6399683-Lingulodinium_polyedra.AAC.1